MRKLNLILMLMLSAFSVFSQMRENGGDVPGQSKAGNPTVYVEYVCEDSNKVFLRMFNNTIWTLAVESDRLYYKTPKVVKLGNGTGFYAMPNDKEVSLNYFVEKFALPSKKVKLPKISYPDSVYGNWIAADDSILFSVPLDYLKADLQIFIYFNYEWEVTTKGVILPGPQHRISFRGIGLPDLKKTCSK